MSDNISRADAIEAVLTYFIPRSHTGERGEHEEDFVRTIFKALPSAEAEWIPCSERMPKEKEIVLITNDKGNVRFGQFRGTHGKYWTWKGNTLETVLAWMPLPKPWKGADDEDS